MSVGASWRRDAECRVVDPRIFFGYDDESEAERTLRERAAIALCDGCGVRGPCGEFAMTNDVVDGIWGGMTEAVRQKLAGSHDRPAPGRGSRRVPEGRAQEGL